MGSTLVESNYRVSQKFVRLISCTTTFDQNIYFYMKTLEDVFFFLYRIRLFRIAVTGMSFLFLFFFLSLSIAVAAWSGIERVDPQMIHLELLIYHLVRRSQVNPKQYLFSLSSWKKKYFGHSSKKKDHTGPLPQLWYFFTNLRRAGRYLVD